MKFTPHMFGLGIHQVGLGFVRTCGPGRRCMSGISANQSNITFPAGRLLPVSHQPHRLSLLGSLVRLSTVEQRSDDGKEGWFKLTLTKISNQLDLYVWCR